MRKNLFILSLFFVSNQSIGFGGNEISDIKQIAKFSRESRIEIQSTHSDSFIEWKYKYDLLQAQYDKLESDFQNRPTKGSLKKTGNILTDDEYRQLLHDSAGRKNASRIYPIENKWMNVRFYNPFDTKIKKIEIKFIEDIKHYKDASNEELAKNGIFRDIYWNISDANKDKSVEQIYSEARAVFLSELEKKNQESIIQIVVNSEPYSMENVNFELPPNFDIKNWEVNKLFGE